MIPLSLPALEKLTTIFVDTNLEGPNYEQELFDEAKKEISQQGDQELTCLTDSQLKYYIREYLDEESPDWE